MKKTLLVLLFTSFAGVVLGQEKEYYIGRHTASLQYTVIFLGIQANYQYIFNPKAKFMWMGKAGIGYSPYEPSPYYNVGINLAYGGKNRLFLGMGGWGNARLIGSKALTGDLGYLFPQPFVVCINLTVIAGRLVRFLLTSFFH